MIHQANPDFANVYRPVSVHFLNVIKSTNTIQLASNKIRSCGVTWQYYLNGGKKSQDSMVFGKGGSIFTG